MPPGPGYAPTGRRRRPERAAPIQTIWPPFAGVATTRNVLYGIATAP